MITAGLTGGYATGKSFVAGELAALGCHLIYADRLGHQVLEPGGAAFQPALQAFGPAILAPDGSIDRKRLASIVFGSKASLEQLNSFVHPAVFELETQKLAEIQKLDPQAVAVVEAAILIETGRYKLFDRIILTACGEELQIERGMKRDHLTREQVLERLHHQLPLEEKKRHAHYFVETSGTPEQTRQQVRAVYADLAMLAAMRSA